MALSYVGTRGSNNTSATTSTTLAVAVTSAISGGDLIVVFISNHNNVAPTSVTDAASNTYTLVNISNGTTVTGTIAYCANCSPLASGQSITATWASGRFASMIVHEFAGAASGAADKTATATGASASPSVGPTAATTQADELILGLFAYSNPHTFAAGAGYTALTGVESTGTVRGVACEYKIVAATGAQTAAGTFNSSATYAGVIITIKQAAAGAVPNAPSGLTATAVGTSAINLSWTDNAADETAYKVERSPTGSGSWTQIAGALAANTTTYSDTGLSSGTTYYYRVRCSNASGNSSYSSTANATTYAVGSWNWTQATRELLDRQRVVTIASTGGEGYLGVSVDTRTWTWYAGPLGVDGRTLTLVASEAAAQAAPVALPSNGVWYLPSMVEVRATRLGHRSLSGGYTLREFYPRRLVQADDVEAESITAFHIASGTITADEIASLIIVGKTISTANSGARITMNGDTYGGLIGYGASDTYSTTLATGTYQILWSLLDGKFYAGGGTTILDANGILINNSTGTPAITEALKLQANGTTVTYFSAYDDGSNAGTYLQSTGITGRTNKLNIENQLAFADSAGHATSTLMAAWRTDQAYINVDYNNGVMSATIKADDTSVLGALHTSGSVAFGDAVQSNIRVYAKGQDSTSSNYTYFANDSGGNAMFFVRNDGGVLVGKSSGKVSFYGGSPASKPTVTGSRGGNAALQSLLTALAGLNLLTDSSS